ncbi:phage tail tube protein [Mesorhizobium sp.]|uniref:phage tail tube protein n=1 Tax=Mesorhizobium sp. TaxID=1871066 RepID=UPI000FE7A931|nr:phage tail tube protein [Mesorhizobium sp.]RWC58922.1 MAG: hypothetical protein EOS56_18610 [Mesorhizobium sp.]RWC66534.1 MAG: hypothetical protein EOS29_03965 [Mesorhizobium sp.]
MAIRRFKQLAALLKMETVYGTDPVPTGAANFIQLSDVTFTPMAGDEEARNLLQPTLGHQGIYLTGNYIQAQFSVELAGSGELGTPPAYGPLLRSVGFAETITPDVDVQYDLVHSNFESSALYWNETDVKHIGLGGRGTATFVFTPKRIPRMQFTMKFLEGTISDTAMPVVDESKWIDAVPVSKANTTMSLHGWSAIAESLNLDLANQVVPRHLIGAESIEITDRQVTGTAVVEAKTLATVNWFAIAKAHTKGPLAVTHGTVVGNRVAVSSDAIQIGRPASGQTDNIRNYSLPLMVTSLGSKELNITVT